MELLNLMLSFGAYLKTGSSLRKGSPKDNRLAKTLIRLSNEFDSVESEEGIICSYDKEFPVINYKVKTTAINPIYCFIKVIYLY